LKTKHVKRKGTLIRGVFCTVLSCALLASVLALNGIAAPSESVPWDGKVVSCATHTAALSGGDLYVWGSNESGQFPGLNLTYSPEPIKVLSDVSDVAVSSGRTLVVKKSGQLVSYGKDPLTGKTSKVSAIGTGIAKVAAEDDFAAYITKKGALYTWGQNKLGQLGNGSTESEAYPVKIMDSGVTQVDLGTSFALALKEDGSAYGWGSDGLCEFGYVKNGSYPEIVSSPVKVMDDVKQVCAGASHSCFVKEDGSLWTCGSNSHSQVGNGSTDLTVGLTHIMDDVKSVSAGSAHNFAIANDGTVYAWGSGVFGQLGTGDVLQPTPTETNFDYTRIFIGDDSTFAVSSDGIISSWGENTNYLLGKTDGSDSPAPMRILDKDMNWIYEESLNADYGHHHGAENPDADVSSDPSDLPAEPVEPVVPEIVSTPFVSGYGDGGYGEVTFCPDNNIKRGEFLRMLVSALCKDFDETKDYGTVSFSDIPVGKWYEKYIAYAEQNQLINGYPDGTFHPEDFITKAEASSMLVKFLGLGTDSAPDAEFTDVASTYWAASAINALVAEDILHGNGDGTFLPDKNISRAEAATVVAQAVGFKPSDSEKADLVTEFPSSPFKDVPASAWYYGYVLRAAGYVK